MRNGSSAPPPLAVGLPVYNGLPYVEESIRSILQSDFADLELIVSDNASTDGTAELVQELAREDSRIRYFRNAQNIGAARNYNRCLELSRSPYFRWAAADDLISRGMLGACVAALEADPGAVLAYPETRLIDASGELISEHDDGDGWTATRVSDRFRFALGRWGLSNVMFGVIRSSVLHHVQLQGNYPASDLVMQTDLAIHGRFTRVTGEYYYRRMHEGCTDSLDAVALARFYDPDRPSPFRAKTLRLVREHMKLVWQAPVPWSEKWPMWVELGRRIAWARSAIVSDLVSLARS